MPDPPTGTVTFLFTDVEGSTKLWEQHPEAMKPALAHHDAILRASVESHHGYVVKMRGDGIHAAFATASDALDAALAAQRILQSKAWGETGALRVRCALHTGAVEERDGDYFGSPVNRAARLLATGHGGQVLLSLATQELVRDGLPPGVGLCDLGTHRLNDLVQPEHIFQLVAPDLPAGFPPLTTLDSRLNNLPVQPTPLIGREKQVAVVQAMLRRDDVRLVTLTGPGGTGKTRLGLQVAADLSDDFEHGVYFVNLAPISDPSLVASTIAQTVKVRETGGQSLIASLKDYLCEKQMLLLLDNFEQVVAAAPSVADLLAACPRLKMLLTSRETLHLRGEHEYPVPPLALPDPKRLSEMRPDLAPTLLPHYSAVALFSQRAQAVKPDFRITDRNAAVVAEICVRVDGLPLAIELAAARCKMLSPQAILSRLSSRLALLTGGAHDLPGRQQTLRDAIAWSYDLLDAREKTLFARLAVFAGGCTLEAAESVCHSPELEIDILDGLTSLVNKSLLRQIEGTGDEPRFTMLETIREYALECLGESGETESLRCKHAEYHLVLAEKAEPELAGRQQVAWLDRLEGEHDNLRAALGWAIEHCEGSWALRLGGALGQFWFMRSYFSEGRWWLAKALDIVQSGSSSASARAKALNWAGYLAYRQTDLASARSVFEEGLTLARGAGEKQVAAHALNGLGNVGWTQGNLAAARSFYEESLALRREVADKWGISISLSNLGNVAWGQSDYTAARAYYEEGLAIGRELGDRQGIAWTLNVLGGLALTQGDCAAARSFLEESLAIQREVGDKSGSAESLNNLGMLARNQGDHEQAAALSRESLALYREIGDKGGSAEALKNLGLAVCGQGDYAAARSFFEEAISLGREAGHQPAVAASLDGLGVVAYEQGDYAAARTRHVESLVIWWEVGYKPAIASCLEGLARVACAQDHPERAAQLLGAAEALREAIGVPLPPADRAQHGRHRERGRAKLGEEMFAAAWTEGRAMTLEQAVAYALEEK